jgi:type IV secretory pathway VirB4 component
MTDGDEGYAWLVESLGGRWVKTSPGTSFGKS